MKHLQCPHRFKIWNIVDIIHLQAQVSSEIKEKAACARQVFSLAVGAQLGGSNI